MNVDRNFAEVLNQYLEDMSISSKELIETSSLSSSTIRRFRNGERAPAIRSEAFNAIVDALLLLATRRGYQLSRNDVIERFSGQLNVAGGNKAQFRYNLNKLISTFGISNSALSRSINYDASIISRIRTGNRQASDVPKLASDIASYIAIRYSDDVSLKIAAELLACDRQILADNSVYREKLFRWLMNDNKLSDDSSLKFLRSVNDFNLDEYIKAIHFDEFKVPSVPFQVPMGRTYTGLEGFKKAELDWLKSTVLSKSMDPVIMYSDMPMEEIAKDLDFGKKWMYGMALMLKKGLQIHQIHNINRSFNEMMLGLESWIPLYMTGQITPYYFKSVNNSVFMNFFRLSGRAACQGEAIAGHHSLGRCTFIRGSEGIEYYKLRGQALLSKASPLMEIYDEAKFSELEMFWNREQDVAGDRRSILSSLPFYTMSDKLLEKILIRNQLPDEDIIKIEKELAKRREMVQAILSHSKICDEIPVLQAATFEEHTMSISISEIFYSKDIRYTYEEYLEHLEETREFARNHDSYSLIENSHPVFSNIQIKILKKKWVVISKDKTPTIHFAIRHPKLRESIENMVIPVVE